MQGGKVCFSINDNNMVHKLNNMLIIAPTYKL